MHGPTPRTLAALLALALASSANANGNYQNNNSIHNNGNGQPHSVPDGGSTAALLGLSFALLVLSQRKIARSE